MKKEILAMLLVLLLCVGLVSACGTRVPDSGDAASTVPPLSDLTGEWTGVITDAETDEGLAELQFTFNATCEEDAVCGTYVIPALPCSGELVYNGMDGDAFVFTQYLTAGDINACGTESVNKVIPQADGTLSQTWSDGTNNTYALMTRQ